ncbi:MAG: M24 family metallopeptidase [Candidatus Hadarchaeum sp.]|uniref:M24 family metallopeptidase n=1 Tax=Candidatus Hadarchaeum sp. TaxID=2883567 RepID=UPI003D0DB3FB
MKKIERLREELGRRGLDAYLAISNTRYLAATTAAKAVIVPADAEPVLVCSRLELERARRESRIRDIRAFSSWRAPLQRGERVYFLELWQLLAEVLEEIGARAVGYDSGERNFIRKIRRCHEASYLWSPEVMQELRMIKSPEELKLLRRSAEIAVLGMNRAAELIEPGVTELEIAAEVEYRMRRAGSEGTPFPTIVASGDNSWLPHSTATSRKLKEGELVVVDLGAIFNGYTSDMTRTFAISPNRRQLRILETVKAAQRAALRKIKDGVKAKLVDAAARETIRRAGYAKFFNHGTGHGVGLEIHEAPSLYPSSRDILRKGMVLTVEPGIYIPGVGGARWEDTVLVKAEGHETLTC